MISASRPDEHGEEDRHPPPLPEYRERDRERARGPRVLWYGELTTRPRLLRRGTIIALAAVLWTVLFLLLPSVVLVAQAFAQRGEYGGIQWSFTLENFNRLAGYGTFGWSADMLIILARSLWIAAVTTLISLLLAYPLAFLIATRRPHTRYLLLALVMIPFCTNLVVRNYAWALMFSRQMFLAKLAAAVGIIAPDAPLYPSPMAVYVGMVSSFLPFAVLPLYTNVERMDWSMVEAAQDLYAGKWRVFRHAVLPQTIPGLAAAVILTFIPAMGTFVVPDMLGGAKYMLVGNLVQQQFESSRDQPFGAAISFALMAVTLVVLLLLRRRGTELEVA